MDDMIDFSKPIKAHYFREEKKLDPSELHHRQYTRNAQQGLSAKNSNMAVKTHVPFSTPSLQPPMRSSTVAQPTPRQIGPFVIDLTERLSDELTQKLLGTEKSELSNNLYESVKEAVLDSLTESDDPLPPMLAIEDYISRLCSGNTVDASELSDITYAMSRGHRQFDPAIVDANRLLVELVYHNPALISNVEGPNQIDAFLNYVEKYTV